MFQCGSLQIHNIWNLRIFLRGQDNANMYAKIINNNGFCGKPIIDDFYTLKNILSLFFYSTR